MIFPTRLFRRADKRAETGTRPARHDAFIVLAVSVVSLALSVHFELFEQLMDFAEHHEAWELDEFFTLFIVTSLGGAVFSARRLSEYRAELKRRRDAEAHIQRLALHDPLTDMPNRRMLAAEMRRLTGSAEAFACLAIDLDRFKPVNDLYGHAVGDALLKHVGGVLREIGGPDAVAARLGGDEFALVLKGADSDRAVRTAEALIAALTEPLDILGKTCQIGLSVGIAHAPDHGDTADDLLRRADVALYRAKAEGRGRTCLFEPGMDDHVHAQARLQRELTEALRRNEIRPHFHGLVDLGSGELRGFEILARWNHPERGQVPPELFVPMAEAMGVITELSCQVLRQACLDARRWPPHLTLALNISPRQLQDPWLVERLLQVLLETGFPTRRLEIEITEDALIADIESARTLLDSLKRQGVRVVLDDFGTGYSSLQHLRDLPFDTLKIDRSFLLTPDESGETMAIIQAIVGLARSLNVDVTAEGVETEANRDLLLDMGCTSAQGYLYGEPVDGASISHRFGFAGEVAGTGVKPMPVSVPIPMPGSGPDIHLIAPPRSGVDSGDQTAADAGRETDAVKRATQSGTG